VSFQRRRTPLGNDGASLSRPVERGAGPSEEPDGQAQPSPSAGVHSAEGSWVGSVRGASDVLGAGAAQAGFVSAGALAELLGVALDFSGKGEK
jgi:hypothetical protein